MPKQRHDTGWKKRQPDYLPEPVESQELAWDLVNRGLASKQILEPQGKPRPRRQFTNWKATPHA